MRTKRPADRARMNMKCIFADYRAWPDAIHQLIFGDDLAGRPGEYFDDLKSPTANRHGRAEDPEFAAGKVDLAPTRGMNQPDVLLRHVCGLSCGFVHIVWRLAIALWWRRADGISESKRLPSRRLRSYDVTGAAGWAVTIVNGKG